MRIMEKIADNRRRRRMAIPEERVRERRGEKKSETIRV